MAVLAGVLGQVVEGVGGMDEGLAGDASSNKTCTAGSFTLDDDGLQTELGRADGSNVAARACADDKNLAIFCLHSLHLT